MGETVVVDAEERNEAGVQLTYAPEMRERPGGLRAALWGGLALAATGMAQYGTYLVQLHVQPPSQWSALDTENRFLMPVYMCVYAALGTACVLTLSGVRIRRVLLSACIGVILLPFAGWVHLFLKVGGWVYVPIVGARDWMQFCRDMGEILQLVEGSILPVVLLAIFRQAPR